MARRKKCDKNCNLRHDRNNSAFSLLLQCLTSVSLERYAYCSFHRLCLASQAFCVITSVM